MKKTKLLSAKQRNVLKHRIFQIALFLFYVEDLKKFIIGSMKATSLLRGEEVKKKKLDDHLLFLVEQDIITPEEKAEFVGLIDYRNEIAHEIHLMTFDIDDNPLYKSIGKDNQQKYDYGALFRVRRLAAKIERGIQSKFAMQVSFRGLMFEATEQTLEHECKLLFKKILKDELEQVYADS